MMVVMSALMFDILEGCKSSAARIGRVTTPHGAFDTPAFMPVGTQATIKGLMPGMVSDLGSQIILANTYHLMLRPGSPLIESRGGLHKWMRWPGPILTDSGGYQVFSLAHINTISETGVIFSSHIDGARIELTPSRAIQIQNELGGDIIMAFDDCPPAMAGLREQGNQVQSRGSSGPRASTEPVARIQQACQRSVRWLDRCVAAHKRSHDQALFGIIQGGVDLDQRDWCLRQVCSHDLPGFAIGGVSVGEGHEGLKKVVQHVAPKMPQAQPRYLMGVGYERDILVAVRAGIDMFDCVLPTRNGRNACAFTSTGRIKLRNARFSDDPAPLDPTCDCPACGGGYSRSYLRHLFMSGEMLGPILTSAHNIRHFQRFLLDIRYAIAHNAWPLVQQRWPTAFATDIPELSPEVPPDSP